MSATAAAKRAGYSEKTAHSQGPRLLEHVGVKAAIDEALRKREKRTEITADRVLRELSLIAFSDMADYVNIDTDGSVRVKTFEEMPEGASRNIAKIEDVRRILGSGEGDGKEMILEARLKFGHYSKERALELIGKHLGMFTDKVEHMGEVAINVTKKVVTSGDGD